MKKETEKKEVESKKTKQKKNVNSSFFLPTESIRNKKKTAYWTYLSPV